MKGIHFPWLNELYWTSFDEKFVTIQSINFKKVLRHICPYNIFEFEHVPCHYWTYKLMFYPKEKKLGIHCQLLNLQSSLPNRKEKEEEKNLKSKKNIFSSILSTSIFMWLNRYWVPEIPINVVTADQNEQK